MRRRSGFRLLSLVPLFLLACIAAASSVMAAEPFCPDGSHPDPDVLWCDDFDDTVPLSRKYFEYNGGNGSFSINNGVGWNGSAGMRASWRTGQVEAGNLKILFGRGPLSPRIHPDADFREIYWRFFLKMEKGWTGNPYKLSRATIIADRDWAQAMIAHLWEGSVNGVTLGIDPASGIDSAGFLATTKYNDFPNLRWLGHKRGTTPVFSRSDSGRWRCIEAHVRLNAPGASDGVFEFWVDGRKEAGSDRLDWVRNWQEYGINAIFIENYWNGGAHGERTRYFDNFVISRSRIGCGPAESAATDSAGVPSEGPAVADPKFFSSQGRKG